ncbi:MAG: hypothetical protein L0346_04335 [Chloroflexi bacterium]|nr:hypothetical protein [Chloroflexota bacterium]
MAEIPGQSKGKKKKGLIPGQEGGDEGLSFVFHLRHDPNVVVILKPLIIVGDPAGMHIQITPAELQVRDGETVYTELEAGQLTLGDTAGGEYVVASSTGVRMYAGGVLKVDVQADGDVFIGEDTSSPGKTYFSIFSGAQTYNSESMSAGDMLIGDNSASKANILWDKSAGQLLFRGGTAAAAYIDTDGSVTAGGGVVFLDADGVTVTAEPSTTPDDLNAYKFEDEGGAIIGGLYMLAPAGSNRLQLYAPEQASHDSEIDLFVGAPSGQDASLNVNVDAGSKAMSFIMVNDSTNAFFIFDGDYARFDAMDVRVDGGVYIGGIGTDPADDSLTVDGAVTLNESGGNNDFRVEGDTQANLLFVDASQDNIGIGTGSPNASAALDITSTVGALLVPRMTTTQRDALTAANGMVIYNTTTAELQGYVGGAWKVL